MSHCQVSLSVASADGAWCLAGLAGSDRWPSVATEVIDHRRRFGHCANRGALAALWHAAPYGATSERVLQPPWADCHRPGQTAVALSAESPRRSSVTPCPLREFGSHCPLNDNDSKSASHIATCTQNGPEGFTLATMDTTLEKSHTRPGRLRGWKGQNSA